jgi:hypothetical protein
MHKITKLPNDGTLREIDGVKCWHLNGHLHRTDGPAIEYPDGHKQWWVNGKWHREDGPAIEWADGNKSWYLNDKQIPCKTQEEFERLMRLKAFW